MLMHQEHFYAEQNKKQVSAASCDVPGSSATRACMQIHIHIHLIDCGEARGAHCVQDQDRAADRAGDCRG